MHTNVHQVAQQGFTHGANLYEQVRPSYPTEVVDFIKSLSDETPDIVVDLAAGTGKFTRLLGPLKARELIAIEPVAEMRGKLKNIPIRTKIIDAAAEQLPLDDHTVDIIICAHSFHWFANLRALAEFHRVLKPTGRLILLWNDDDKIGEPWRDDISTYAHTFQSTEGPSYKRMQWIKIFDDQNYFSSLEKKRFTNQQTTTRDLIIKRTLSESFISALPLEEQEKIANKIKKMLDDAEEIRGIEEIHVKYFTNVYWCSPLANLI